MVKFKEIADKCPWRILFDDWYGCAAVNRADVGVSVCKESSCAVWHFCKGEDNE